MPVMSLTLDLDEHPWTDLPKDDALIHVTTPFRVGGLPRGMRSGKASVAFSFTLPDGRQVLAETSMELFLAAARAFRARFGEFGEAE